MDQKKIGAFIRKLRKEKNLTQEQLAELFSVSNRTVSRWETGYNIPDLSVLIELSDYFGVEIREMIDGERREKDVVCTSGNDSVENESVAQAEHENLLKAANYSVHKEKMFAKTLFVSSVCSVFAWLISFVFLFMMLDTVTGGGLVLVGEMVALLTYICVMLCFKRNRTSRGYLSVLIGAASAISITNLLQLLLFFRTGTYYNYGLIGAYYAAFIVLFCFITSGIITCVVNKRIESTS